MVGAALCRRRVGERDLEGIGRGLSRHSFSSCLDRKRPISGESRTEAATQLPSTIATDIAFTLKITRFAGVVMIGGGPCQEINTYVVDVYMTTTFLAPGLHIFSHRQRTAWRGSVVEAQGFFR